MLDTCDGHSFGKATRHHRLLLRCGFCRMASMQCKSNHIESNEHVRNLEEEEQEKPSRQVSQDLSTWFILVFLFFIQQTLERVTGEILVYAAMVFLADNRLQLFESFLRVRLVPFSGFGILC